MQNTMGIIKEFFREEKLIPENKLADCDENLSLLETGTIDSLNILKLISYIEENFQLKFLDEDLTPENFENLNAILKCIEIRLHAGSL
jgi:acyl carrier protein